MCLHDARVAPELILANLVKSKRNTTHTKGCPHQLTPPKDSRADSAVQGVMECQTKRKVLREKGVGLGGEGYGTWT